MIRETRIVQMVKDATMEKNYYLWSFVRYPKNA